MIYIIKALSP